MPDSGQLSYPRFPTRASTRADLMPSVLHPGYGGVLCLLELLPGKELLTLWEAMGTLH